MDNKLSELSKPVFEIEVSGGHWLNCSSGKLTPDAGADFTEWPDGINRLYSQEYVSALLAELEASDEKISARRQEVLRSLTERAETAEQKLAANNSEWFQLFPMASPRVVAMMNVDLQNAVAKRDQRIAELERANKAQDDHINQQQDRIDSLEKKNADLGRALGAAEKRLAAPVRLPSKNDDEFWFGSTFQVAKFDRAVERAISAAGFTFTVEGDE